MAKFLRLSWTIFSRFLLAYSVVFAAVGTVALIVLFLWVGRPILKVRRLRTENPKETIFMRQFREQARERGQAARIRHGFVSLGTIPPCTRSAVLAAEDDGFYFHPGFEVNAIIEAYQYNQLHKNRVRGASTITQQLAKNLFLSSEKSISRKVQELYYALLMEWLLDKNRILELYLNYAEWGKGIFGMEAASRHYFQKSCRRLTASESAKLAAVLAMPTKLNPHHYQSPFMQKRLAVIANNLRLHRQANDSVYELLLDPQLLPAEADPLGAEAGSQLDSSEEAFDFDNILKLVLDPWQLDSNLARPGFGTGQD